MIALPEPHRRALEILSTVTRGKATDWKVVAQFVAMRLVGDGGSGDRYVAQPGYHMRPGVWYDFADPRTGRYGQCQLRADGTWVQPPRGDAPVVLEWVGCEKPGGAA